jgi:HD-GYP domain-containing protein (c-di-GMP phosphodiesterase class II)
MSQEPALLYFARPTPQTAKVREALAPLGIRALLAEEPADALGHLMDENVGLLLLDGPSLTPFSERLFRQWQEQDPLLEVVGVAGPGPRPEPGLTRMSCRRILRQPLDTAALREVVDRTLQQRAQRAALVRGDETIASLVLQATQALVTAVELKDAYTRGRADRVALFAGILADEVGGVDVDRIRTATRIMDVGKTGVPEPVLNKTDRLTDEEFEQIKRHPIISWEMLRHLFRDDVVLGVARHHHERWDGRGYPDGLAGEAIPLEARIAAIADSLDAITSTRAFRQARLWSEAVDEIVKGSGTRYDPSLVEVFRKAKDRLLVGA